MEIGWTDVGSGGYILVSCASNTSNYDYFMGLFEFVVGNVATPTLVIKYNQCCSRRISQSDCSFHIKLNYKEVIHSFK